MTATQTHRVFNETRVRRDEARSLLRALLDAKQRTESAHHGARPVADSLEHVTGRSAMDKAIESTSRLVDSFNRVLEDLRSGLSVEDLALLEEIEAEEAGAVSVVLGGGCGGGR